MVKVSYLHLLNTLLGLIIVYITISLPFGIWMLRGFVAAVPVELEEAAFLDGASWWRMFRWSKKFEVRALYTKRPLDKTEAMPISGVPPPVIITRHP